MLQLSNQLIKTKPQDQLVESSTECCTPGFPGFRGCLLFSMWVDSLLCGTGGGVQHRDSGAGGPEAQAAVCLCGCGLSGTFSEANSVLGRAEP